MIDKRKISNGYEILSGLTNREHEVLRLIALGASNKDISAKLEISDKTVKNHITNIFQTIHVDNRTQAALYALDNS